MLNKHNSWLYNNFLVFIFNTGHPCFLQIWNTDILKHELDEILDNK